MVSLTSIFVQVWLRRTIYAMLCKLQALSIIKVAARRLTGEVRKQKRFSVDRTVLDANLGMDAEDALHSVVPKELISPLGKDLKSYIKLKGPITLHDYMAQCLNHLMHGYYQSKGEVIGEKGDFITAPEVSQLFGEMIGIWCLSTWEQLGKPQKINLVELGPGKGTLMKDLMGVTSKFGAFKAAASVHMVELSIPLRKAQYERLGCTGVTDFTDARDAPIFDKDGKIRAAVATTGIQDSKGYATADGTMVQWHSFLHQVPTDAPVLIVGQEFLDAFPIHQFTYTDKGWRERLVDVNGPAAPAQIKPHVPVGNPRIEAAKRSVLSKSAHAEGGLDSGAAAGAAGFDQKKMDEEAAGYHFRLVLSKTETPAVKLLLTGSEDRLKRDALEQAVFGRGKPAAAEDLKPLSAADVAPPSRAVGTPSVGDGIEVCPLAYATCEDVAARVVKAGGAALLFDYGEDFAQEDSLRAFKKHQQVSVLSQPGLVDVTADVDFAMCRRAAERKGARVPALLSQGDFLMRMGVVQRVEQLLDSEETSDQQADNLFSSLKYLVQPEHMGQKFKVLCIASPTLPPLQAFET